MTNFDQVLSILADGGVDFIVVGGVAAAAHGALRATADIDLVYSRSPENIRLLVLTLAPYHPYPRGAPPGLPFLWDQRTVTLGLNFTLDTALGHIDLLGEIAGGGGYESLRPHSVVLSLFGRDVRCLGLDKLIDVKRAAGRPKDYEAIAELEALREERALRDEDRKD